MVNAQEWLNENYPKEGTCIRRNDYDNFNKTRKQTTKLNINGQNLQGSLKLEGFVNLECLYCSGNQLIILDCNDCGSLEVLNYSWNQLTNLSFLNNLQEEKIKELYIHDNNFPESDLTPLSRFINLRELDLNNNNFIGSLKPLQEMVKLKYLDISNTDINSGLEYLPESITDFYCSADEREDAKVKTLEKQFWQFGRWCPNNQKPICPRFTKKMKR